jgi:predicted ATP-grasp superfamily ATP-dependent carboligase
MFVYPYKKGSKSAKSLGQSLGCKVLTRPKRSRIGTVINWGNSNHINYGNRKILNTFPCVQRAANKLLALNCFKESNVSCPDFTTDIEVAKQWIADEEVVVCRTLLRSHSGKGIVIATNVNELVSAPLYVKYFKKSFEYRVHVFNGKVIDYVQKKKRSGLVEGSYNKYIRSHNNGWVFCRNNIAMTSVMEELAINAVKCLGLDFGAVDIVVKSNGEMKVLEVNTAPSMMGQTLISYSNAIKEYVNDSRN